MARLLLVDSGSEVMTALAARLTTAGHDLTLAPTAFFALTALEWQRPAVIVASATLSDMSGDALCSIIRSDPATKTLQFVLVGPLDNDSVQRAAQAGVDLLLAGALASRVLADGVMALVSSEVDDTGPARSGPTVPPVDAEGGFAGSLEIMDMATVIQAVAQTGMSGRLSVTLRTGSGVVVFDRGRPIHASFVGEDGESAVMGLLAFGADGGTFTFTPAEDDSGSTVPRTIKASLKQLLLAATADVDARGVTLDEAASGPTNRKAR